MYRMGKALTHSLKEAANVRTPMGHKLGPRPKGPQDREDTLRFFSVEPRGLDSVRESMRELLSASVWAAAVPCSPARACVSEVLRPVEEVASASSAWRHRTQGGRRGRHKQRSGRRRRLQKQQDP